MIRLGLIGYPLGHSLSPKLHMAALESCGLEGDYSLFPIPPDDQKELKDLLASVRSGEITGLNVTIPHKQNIIPLLDELTPTANTIGAVNTIYLKNGKLTGDNTDMPGFLSDLHNFLCKVDFGSLFERLCDEDSLHKTSEVYRNKALVLGAGGSARAVVFALLNNGWNVAISSRRPEQAQELLTQLPVINSRLSIIEYPITNLYSLFSNLSLIVNTTPLGMFPDIESSPWPADLPFPPSAAVYDLVYNPRETKLVRDARAAGLPASTGLGMLIEQAALAFEIWTGCKPSSEDLFASIH